MIFYEAPHKLLKTLEDMREVFGDERKISLSRELTKLNEETVRTTLSGALTLFTEKEPRGEYVLVVEGNSESEENELSKLSVPEHIDYYVQKGLSKKDAIKAVAKDRDLPKSEIYKYTIEN